MMSKRSRTTVRSALAIVLIAHVSVLAPVAKASQTRTLSPTELADLVQARARADEADREVVERVLRRPEVRAVAERMGLPLAQAEAAVATLSGDELRQLGERARAVESELVGGQSRVIISTTTIIIALLLVILLVVALD